MAVLLCSGQGAQKPHMGESLLEVPEVAEVFARASKILNLDLPDLVRNGSEEDINNTFNAQALTMALSVGIGRALEARGLAVDAVIGFSLGEISGLALSGVLSVEDAFSLLNVRAHSMDEACAKRAGGMLALLGVDEEAAREICETALAAGKEAGVQITDACGAAQSEVLVLANYNCPGQIVLSGDVSAIERAQELCKERKTRCTRLATAGAFHSPLMQSASDVVREFCATLSFNEPRIPLICNTDAQPFVAAEATDRLAKQIISPVRYEQGVRYLIDAGNTEFVEAGFGGVLFNMMKRIDKTVTRHKVGNLDELNALFED